MLIGTLQNRNIIYLGHDHRDYFVAFRKKDKVDFYRLQENLPFLSFELAQYQWCNFLRDEENNVKLVTNACKEFPNINVIVRDIKNGNFENEVEIPVKEYRKNCNLRKKDFLRPRLAKESSQNLMVIKNNHSLSCEEFFDTAEFLFGRESVDNLRSLKKDDIAIVGKRDLSIKYLGKCPIRNPDRFWISSDELTVAMCNGSKFAIIDLSI